MSLQLSRNLLGGAKLAPRSPICKGMLLMLLLADAATAQTEAVAGETIALRFAVKMAVQANPALGAAVTDVAIADASVEAARGLDDLVFEAEVGWNRLRQDVILNSPLQQPSADDVSGSLSLTKPLSTGGELGLQLYNQYSRIEFATQNGVNSTQLTRQTAEAYTPSLQLVFQQPLLRGAGRSVARAPQRLSAVARSEAGALREWATSVLVREVVDAYSELAFASAQLDIQREAEASAVEQLERVLAEIEVGKQPPTGSAEVRVALARRKEAALLASQSMVESSLELARVMGRAIDRRTMALAAEDELPLPEPPPSVESTLASANAHNPELAAARFRRGQRAIEVEVREDDALPRMDMLIAAGPLGYSSELDAAYRDMAGLHGYSINAGFRFSEPIGRHAAHGARTAAHEGYAKAETLIEALEQQIAAAAVAGLAGMDTALQRSKLLASAVEDAELDLEAERARFQSGRSTNFDVLRRQDQVAQMKLSAIAARLDYAKARTSVDAATGALLERYEVVIR